MILVLIGWWYIRSKLLWGTFTGAVHGYHGPGQIAPVPPVPAPAADATAPVTALARPGASLSDYYHWAREWLGTAYRTFWFHFLEFEAPRGTWLYYLPGATAAAGALAYAVYVVDRWRTLLDPTRAVLRQSLLIAASSVTFVAPFLVEDLQRRADGGSFLTAAGRFLLPTYAPLVVCALIGVLWIVRERLQPVVLAAMALFAGYFVWAVWDSHYVGRYFGTTTLSDAFQRMTYDRPEFVSAPLLWVVLVSSAAALIGAAVAILRIARTERTGDDDVAVSAPAAEAERVVGEPTPEWR